MDLTWQQFLGLAVTSGAAAGLANQGFKFLHDWIAEKRQSASQARELEHQKALQHEQLSSQQTAQERELAHRRDLQRDERDHQAAVRREAAFFEARKELLPCVVGVHDWVGWWWGDLYGAEVDYHRISHHPPRDIATAADAIQALQEVAGEHPSKDVRSYARGLADDIDGVVNMPDPSGDSDPSVEQLSNWQKRAQQLVDALHDPDYKLEQTAVN